MQNDYEQFLQFRQGDIVQGLRQGDPILFDLINIVMDSILWEAVVLIFKKVSSCLRKLTTSPL